MPAYTKFKHNPLPLGAVFLAALTGAGATAGAVLTSEALKQDEPVKSNPTNNNIIIGSAFALGLISLFCRRNSSTITYSYQEKLKIECG